MHVQKVARALSHRFVVLVWEVTVVFVCSEGFDEESPLAESGGEACPDREPANGGSGEDSPPPTPEVLSNTALPRMRLPHEGMSHGGGMCHVTHMSLHVTCIPVAMMLCDSSIPL